MNIPRLGIVGLGRMGANMARRLKDTGENLVVVHDTRTEAALALAGELGVHAAESLAEVSARADIILTVVSDDAAMRAIFATAGDSLLRAASGRIFINCATLTPALQVEVAQLCERAGAFSLEACMASSIPQARQGTLYLMCGGRPEVFARVKPLLEKLASQVRYIGPAGEAAKVKALVNMVMNGNTAVLAEGLGLGAALGLEVATLREVFAETGANSRVLQTDGEDMQNRDHACFFSAAHAAKDSGIACQLAEQAGLHLPLATATWQQYREMVRLGLGHLDKSGIAELTFPGRAPGQ